MKVIIDVPDILPANFEEPSRELKIFLDEFTMACTRITRQYRYASGRKLFSAFIRRGADTVINTDSGEIRKIQFERELCEELAGFHAGEDEEDVLYEDDVREDTVVMDDDVPGNWVVARLCIERWRGSAFGIGFETLRSRDFEAEPGKLPRAQKLIERIVRHLEKIAHKVPAGLNK